MIKYLLTLLISLSLFSAFGESNSQEIKYFTVKNHDSIAHKLAIIVSDSLQHPVSEINGMYNFSVNGFSQELNFENGVAIFPLKLEKSAFVFIKHHNQSGDPSHLYFIYERDQNLKPFQISWYLLLSIPIGLILIGYLFRKLIGLVILILILISYFNFSKGLSIPIFLESVLDGLKNLF